MNFMNLYICIFKHIFYFTNRNSGEVGGKNGDNKRMEGDGGERITKLILKTEKGVENQ